MWLKLTAAGVISCRGDLDVWLNLTAVGVISCRGDLDVCLKLGDLDVCEIECARSIFGL